MKLEDEDGVGSDPLPDYLKNAQLDIGAVGINARAEYDDLDRRPTKGARLPSEEWR